MDPLVKGKKVRMSRSNSRPNGMRIGAAKCPNTLDREDKGRDVHPGEFLPKI